MFRLIPFKSMKELEGCFLTPEDLYSDECSSDNILIQDTNDMKVEKFTPDELISFEENNGIWYQGFSFTESLDNEYGSISFYCESFDIVNEKFLNDSVYLEVGDSEESYAKYFPDFDEDDVYDCYEFTIFYNENEVTVGVVTAEDNKNNYSTLLLVNDKPIYSLNTGLNDSGMVYFDIIQFCKTKVGFDIVLYYDGCYFGISFDDSLKILKFHNLEIYECELLPTDFLKTLAKKRLSGG